MRNFIPAYSLIKEKTWDVPKTAGNSWDLMGKTIGMDSSCKYGPLGTPYLITDAWHSHGCCFKNYMHSHLCISFM